ncbi:alanine/glycine:cation symporter family protein [Nocardiopsis metallicus]|uniref:AGCS family alanine or glycine:cation symporter n=1 Tax=Nocardiopsis metallicus TaxID=179819 RepID=A0A840W3H1_9ACTN|nr:alanine/glycine:cation symporter family protein [Nocardiopsis metallicus]MBB5490524.1 AGCS family alanine or glycine:cation symporter [Nocardiopsis metallicus]
MPSHWDTRADLTVTSGRKVRYMLSADAVPQEGGIGATIENAVDVVFNPIATVLSDVVFAKVTIFGAQFPWIVAWLVAAGVALTLYFGFVQFRHPITAVKIARKGLGNGAPGEVTHFQALTAAVSGTVGLGNIAGVAIAVTIGGPGATFWMILAGLLMMAVKFAECTLGVKYREIGPGGKVSGGPMKYLAKGLAERGMAGVGKVLAGLTAAFILIFAVAGGNMFQANQTLEQLRTVTGGEEGLLGGSTGSFVFGVFLALLVGVVVIGGITSITKVTSKLVPSMTIVYVLACVVVIGMNIPMLPDAVGQIISGAFSPTGVAGGALGAMIIGFQRAAFSNEAGIGSSPIALATVKTNYPASAGLVAMLGPFLDTVVICTMTALTIVIASPQSWIAAREAAAAGEPLPGGVSLTSDAFGTVLPWFPYVLTVAVVLFALSTVITWSYYGLKGWTHLFGEGKRSERIYLVIYCVFLVIGSVLTLGAVLDMADALVFAAALFNIIGLYLLAPVVKKELARLLAHLRGEGEKEPAKADDKPEGPAEELVK